MRSLVLLFAVTGSVFAQGTSADYQRAFGLENRYRDTLTGVVGPMSWQSDGRHLWYREDGSGGKHSYWWVDAEAATRAPLLDTAILAEQLSRITGQACRADTLKLDALGVFGPADQRAVRFTAFGRPWEFAAGRLTERKPDAAAPVSNEPSPPRRSRRTNPPNDEFPSPDGKHVATLRDHNIWVRTAPKGQFEPLTHEGTAADGYDAVFWSPDASRLIGIRRTTGGDRQLTLVESAPKQALQPRVSTRLYLKPGDPIPQPKPHLFDVAARREIPVSDASFANPWDVSYEHWSGDSKRFMFVYNQRGHGVVRVLSVDSANGAVTTVVNEECPTFFDYANKLFVRYLDATEELLWMSERGGWNHLYLIDARTGRVKNAVTSGEWAVRGVEHVDEKAREVVVRTVGVVPGEDPYHIHLARVKFDGTGFTRLTEGDGTHTANWSPNRQFFVDTHSRADRPPVLELRSAAGKKLLTLCTADDTALRATGWKPPERFVAKGRDGKTDIHGLIIRPSTFDPAKKYPVVESIYAGPHDQHVPKAFQVYSRTRQLAELGFIVVRCDGMGTNWRSKAFHDVCWKNLADAGFPDRIAWIRAAAAAHPEMDLSRGVGIYGGSAGGQNALRGLLAHPDFYTVGHADCGCHDNRMDKVWWNELWMGWPVGPHYREQSNVTQAHKLTGKLMLVVGELDTNVDPSSTLQVVDALIRADKDFELLVMPGTGHGAAETPYANRRRWDFFVRHLLGVEPRSR